MRAFFAYALLLAGMPVFVGMLVASFVVLPVSRILQKSRLQRVSFQLLEVLNGLVAGVAGAFLFRVCGLVPSLIVPGIIAVWISRSIAWPFTDRFRTGSAG